ncbi:Solute carrier family 35 member G1 [Orchesella cincta]|uniref:Solute carrier family 35 member G1 n=1 Tax=Orchesella cincta TaxID=48709 RepID=A0A1D2MQI4_ORCCI|nr:Solute carrier family 35 member G1 [Orchesella cincta]
MEDDDNPKIPQKGQDQLRSPTGAPPKYENVKINTDKVVIIPPNPVFVKMGEVEDREPTERDKFQVQEEMEVFEGDPSLTVEGQVAFMTNSRLSLRGGGANRRISTVSNKALGWKRYLGLIYTLISTNMFSLSSNILKLMGHVHPLNLGAYAFPVAALLSAPFIWYTLKIEKKPVMTNLLPVCKNKKVVFFMWFRAMTSVAITYGLIASFKYISVADTRTILAASVITVNFFGWICLGEKCGVVPILVAVMALCGIGVMTRPPMLTGAESFDNETLIGVSLAFGCMILATIIILSLRFLQNVHHGVLNTFLYSWAFVSSIPFAIGFGKLEVPDNGWDIVGMLGVGVLWSLGNTFLVLALQAEEAGVVALIRTSEVIFTFFWQMVILHIYPDIISLIGAVLVLTGVIVVTLRKWVASLDSTSSLRKKLGFLLL